MEGGGTRFEVELELMNSLASPEYLHCKRLVHPKQELFVLHMRLTPVHVPNDFALCTNNAWLNRA